MLIKPTKPDVREQIQAFLETPLPSDATDDLRDLGVIGYANGLSGVTAEIMHSLIATARRNGRSWDEIGRRLSMTASEAERAYGKLSDPRSVRPAAAWRHRIAAAIRAVQDAMDGFLEHAAAELEREHIRRW